MAIAMANGQVISAFDKNTDVNVITSIVHPQVVKGLGNLVILNKVTEKATLATTSTDTPKEGTPTTGRAFSNELTITDHMNGILLRKVDTATGAVYREYKNIDAVVTDYSKDTAVYKKAQAYFAQDKHSDRIAVLDYIEDQAQDTLKDFWTFNWTFAILAENELSDTTVLLSNIFEANKDHFLVLQSSGPTDFNKYYGQNYTIGLAHNPNEPMDAAFIGAIANLPVGETTWKFKTLNGITADNFTSTEIDGLNNAHVLAYVVRDGLPEVSEGFTLSGEFIDLLHGELWIKTNVADKLVKLLRNNDKIPYDHNGIAIVQSTIEGVMLEGYHRGIIAERGETGKGNYTVTVSPKEDQSAEDLSRRHYGGASYRYHASSAIHTLTVNGVIDSDTIMS